MVLPQFDSSCWESYLHDAAVMGVTSTIGDLIAQATQNKALSRFSSFMDINRIQKYSVFGLADGIISHTWVYSLATLFQGQSYSDTISSIFADSLFYTPLWCMWFLSAMAALEKKCLKSFFVDSFSSEWQSLLKISLGYYIPLNCIVYSTIPVEYRVTAFAIGSLLNTAIVSYWSSDSTRLMTSKTIPPTALSTIPEVVMIESSTVSSPPRSKHPTGHHIQDQ